MSERATMALERIAESLENIENGIDVYGRVLTVLAFRWAKRQGLAKTGEEISDCTWDDDDD